MTPSVTRPADYASELVAKLVGGYMRSELRGRTRVTLALARRFRLLQAVPIIINRTQRVYVDLRDHLTHSLVAGSPWQTPPAEPDEQFIMRQIVHAGDVAVDIGVHMGLHAVLLAELVAERGAVHAFEANPERFPTLRVTLSRLANATLHEYGLGDSETAATLYVPEEQAMASLSDWTKGRVGPLRHLSCQLRRLDDVVSDGTLPMPDFVKCDVEGAESMVFRGAARTLDRIDAPIILYEANAFSAAAFNETVSSATDFLRGLQSAAFSVFHVQPSGELHALRQFRADCDHYNLLAVPRARYDRLDALAGKVVGV